MDSGAGNGRVKAIRVPYRHLRDAEMELVILNGTPRAGDAPPKDPEHQNGDGAHHEGSRGSSRTKLVLACMVAVGVQFGWALQLSLLTPYIQLVEQELWQKEEKGLIGVLPVRDSEAGAVGSLLSAGVGSDSGKGGSKAGGSAGESSKQDTKKWEGAHS